jgi:hypothetical protein
VLERKAVALRITLLDDTGAGIDLRHFSKPAEPVGYPTPYPNRF